MRHAARTSQATGQPASSNEPVADQRTAALRSPDDAAASIPVVGAPAAGAVPRLIERLLRPVDNSSLAVFRMAFGVAVAWHGAQILSGGSVDYHYIDPVFHFTYYGFDWVRPWPGAGMYVHLAVMIAAALCFALGLFYRAAAVVMFVTFTYLFLCERALYNNHYYLMSLLGLLCIVIPLHRGWSLDALRSPAVASPYLPAWSLWLLRFQLGIVYFYGGVAKLDADWLRGQPMRLWLEKLSPYPVIGAYFTEEWGVQIFVWGGLLLDLLAVPLLLWRRTRLLTFGVIILFHVMNSTLFHIGVFPWLMIAATTIFFPPDWPRRLVRMPKPVIGGFTPPARRWDWRRKLGAAVLGAYVVLQLLIPLRHHLYRGPASWTERGHFFSWRMMLRDKHGAVRFHARNPQTGREGLVDLRPYLTPVQIPKMTRDPEHILQLAHFLAEDFRRQGLGDTEIRVTALVSLNGRKPQLLIDPEVDLVQQAHSWRDYPWVLPLTEPLRHDAFDLPVRKWESDVEP
jgi:hypothetical protein